MIYRVVGIITYNRRRGLEASHQCFNKRWVSNKRQSLIDARAFEAHDLINKVLWYY